MNEAPATSHRCFYQDRIPRDFNDMLEKQKSLGEAGERLYREMAAVDATIRIEVRGEADEAFLLNIEGGRMSASDRAAHPPFLTLIQDEAAFRRLERETRGSFAALLGALAGLGAEMKLTRKRVIDLEAVNGVIRFEVTGGDGFAITTCFGAHASSGEPDAAIRVDGGAYADLRAGRLDPQSAFLDGRIDVEGDMEKVMQLAFSAVAPD
jgi:hypothetical protein